jgi:RimJ/RimL family protein N-acetyltransferase
MHALFETERLKIRLLEPEDAGFILRLLNSPTWLQYLGDRHIRSLEDAGRYLENVYRRGYAENGFGAWLVTLKDSGEPIGLCGLFKRPYLDWPDLGYSLLPEFEGKGYAYEAAFAALSYVQRAMGKTELLAIVSEANTRSRRLLEKLGFVFRERILPPNENKTLLLYARQLQSGIIPDEKRAPG